MRVSARALMQWSASIALGVQNAVASVKGYVDGGRGEPTAEICHAYVTLIRPYIPHGFAAPKAFTVYSVNTDIVLNISYYTTNYLIPVSYTHLDVYKRQLLS